MKRGQHVVIRVGSARRLTLGVIGAFKELTGGKQQMP